MFLESRIGRTGWTPCDVQLEAAPVDDARPRGHVGGGAPLAPEPTVAGRDVLREAASIYGHMGTSVELWGLQGPVLFK